MSKIIKGLTVAALLLSLCVMAAACGRTEKTAESVVALPVDTTQSPVVDPDSQTTEPDSDSQPATKPTLDADFGVGSGRVEGDEEQQSSKPADDEQPVATTPQINSDLNMTYEAYMQLSGSQQQELFDKYFADDPMAFAAWFAKIKAEYEDQRQEVEATGPIDLEDYLTP